MDSLPVITIDDVPAQIVAEIAQNAIAGYRKGYAYGFAVSGGVLIASSVVAAAATHVVLETIKKRKLKKTNLD